jgi:hypothetical protein
MCASQELQTSNMRPLWLAVFGLLLFFRPASPSLVAQRLCPQTVNDWQECERLVEKRLLKKFPSLFHRDGPKLVIRFSDVSPDTFVDGETERGHESSYAGYVLIDYRPKIGYAVLRVWGYESNSVDLVSMKTSLHIDILDTPVFSPDEMRFAVGREDGFGLNSFAVYRVGREDVIREYFEESNTCVPRNVQWLGNRRLSFVEDSFEPSAKKRRVLKRVADPGNRRRLEN